MRTKKINKKHNKTSKRVLEMRKDPNTVWGKNRSLEKFWSELSNKYVVVIYKDGKHKYINLPNRKSKKYKYLFDEFDNDNNIIAVLSRPLSQDSYELGLYPKAKDKTVEYVIQNYTKYFKPIIIPKKINNDNPKMNKIWIC